MTCIRRLPLLRRVVLAALFSVVASTVSAQSTNANPPQALPKSTALPLTIESLGWLEGCWRGAVNQREFREHWLPLKGGIIVGAGHTVMQDKTQDFEYMRVEARPDGVYYVVVPSGKPESSFKLTAAVDDGDGDEFTFTNGVDEFPQRIVYRRGSEGWLYASVEGKLNGEDRRVTYPMRRIVCESGELIRK
jgi:uncharacterized protein DUF6265